MDIFLSTGQIPHLLKNIIGGFIKMRAIKIHMIFAFILLAVFTISVSAQDKMTDKMMKDDKAMSDSKNPVVVIIRADWCPYCKELEPKMAKLMEEFGEKLNFVTLDITTRETAEKAKATAKAAGLSAFFEANKTKASMVAIIKDKKQIFSTVHNTDRGDFAKAFEAAVKE
jgi:thiol-disulfide isomerase/thioredoxin